MILTKNVMFTHLPQVTLYDIYLELLPARCTNLSTDNVGKQRWPGSDEEECDGESCSLGQLGSVRRTRTSLRSGGEGSATSEARVLLHQQEHDDGLPRRADAAEGKGQSVPLVVQVHSIEDKQPAAGQGQAAHESAAAAYHETSL